jgi:hypothetical protein
VYLDLQWNRFVIQYDLYSQIKAFENLKGTSGQLGSFLADRLTKMQYWFGRWRGVRETGRTPPLNAASPFPWRKSAMVIFITFVSSWVFVHGRRGSGDAAIRFYAQYLNRMSRAGHPKHPGETGQEFAERLSVHWPEQGTMAREVTARYYRMRFGGKSL